MRNTGKRPAGVRNQDFIFRDIDFEMLTRYPCRMSSRRELWVGDRSGFTAKLKILSWK